MSLLNPTIISFIALAFVVGIATGWHIRGERKQRRVEVREQRRADLIAELEKRLAASERKLNSMQERHREAVDLSNRQKKQLVSTRAALDEQILRNRKAQRQIDKANALLSDGRNERRTLERQLKLLIKRTSQERLVSPSTPISDKPLTIRSVRGIGPAIARQLAEHGITHLSQIAELDDERIDHLDEKLRFPGRIRRDDWVGQARELLGLADDDSGHSEQSQCA